MVPPVPIPNTVVKHMYAESTCLETGWEDRELLVYKEPRFGGAFFVSGHQRSWISLHAGSMFVILI